MQLSVSKIELIYNPKQDPQLYTPVILTAALLSKQQNNLQLINIKSTNDQIQNSISAVDLVIDSKPFAQHLKPFSICQLLIKLIEKPTDLYSTENALFINQLVDQIETSTTTDLISCFDNLILNKKYLINSTLTLADLFLWSKLAYLDSETDKDRLNKWSKRVENDLKNFLSLLSAYKPKISPNQPKSAKSVKSKDVKTSSGTVSKEDGKYVDLPGAVKGQVVVRFPPEASGYLHIGHAKAALLNQHYQIEWQGKLIFRFDDTNPENEKEDFEDVIREDVALLRIKPDICSYTSDHFELMLQKCEYMLKEGKAYVDDTPGDQMKTKREQRVESKNRNNSVEKNLQMWNEMKQATELGQKCCVRAKIDMKSDNGCLRDPTLYRCKNTPHPRTGTKYKVYPTYDFACPIVDSIEGVTHSLRTTEYMDRDQQFQWFIEALKLRPVYIYGYSRLNLTHTVLSKRRLTWFVENKIVTGWDDPRMPTVRGILRRGLTIDGLKEFIIAQGSSRSVVVMEWDKLWVFNRKIIDPKAARYMGIEKENAVKVNVENIGLLNEIEIDCHPKNSEMGKRKMKVSKHLLIDQTDAALIKDNEVVTFMNLGNVHISKVIKDTNNVVKEINGRFDPANKDFKKTLKVTWLDSSNVVEAECGYYENLITKPILDKENDEFKDYVNTESEIKIKFLVENSLKELSKGGIIQILRKGFFICDQSYDKKALSHTSLDSRIVLISIADGTTDLTNYPKAVQEAKLRLREQIATFAEAKKQAVKQSSTGKSNDPNEILIRIQQQGNIIKELKANKAPKDQWMPLVEDLKKFKQEYQNITGQEWKAEILPSTTVQTTVASISPPNDADQLDKRIKSIGDQIRDLKAAKAPKDQFMPLVEENKKNKEEFKKLTGKEWQPSTTTTSAVTEQTKAQSTVQSSVADQLDKKIKSIGDQIRDLKAAKAPKDQFMPLVEENKKNKEEFKKLTGKEWQPSTTTTSAVTEQTKQPQKSAKKEKQPAKQQATQQSNDGDKKKKQTKLGMETKKSENFSEWYTEVITKSEMIDYYDISGCYVLWEWSFDIWEKITKFLDDKIKQEGVKNVGFPLFVSKRSLEVEKDHIADFAPEVAWVTKSGTSDMQEPIAIRPTSETVMYPYFAKRIKSHRDLPLKVNQWCNVVRWEFKDPTPFLRTREFYWQEGHTAHATKEEAVSEVHKILDHYASVYEYLLAIPVIKGKKTEKEKFPGGDMTTTIEGFISENGRGIQAATSHYLGQNFSKMFDIVFATLDGGKDLAYQNSWGFTTRSIGVMVMEHSDDKGLVLPPRVAPIQVVIIPCGLTVSTSDEVRKNLFDGINRIENELKQDNILVELDASDHNTAGWKFSHWELKGVPLRIELGPKDLEKNEFVAIRRDTFVKESIKIADTVRSVRKLLDDIQTNLFNTAKAKRDSKLKLVDTMDQFNQHLNEKCLILAPFCGDENCEESIKKATVSTDKSRSVIMGAKSLCIPFEQPTKPLSSKCIYTDCKSKPQYFTLFGRSY